MQVIEEICNQYIYIYIYIYICGLLVNITWKHCKEIFKKKLLLYWIYEIVLWIKVVSTSLAEKKC